MPPESTQDMIQNASTELLRMQLMQNVQGQIMASQIVLVSQKQFLEHMARQLRTDNCLNSAEQLHDFADSIGLDNPAPGIEAAARKLGILPPDPQVADHTSVDDDCLSAPPTQGDFLPSSNGRIPNGKLPAKKRKAKSPGNVPADPS